MTTQRYRGGLFLVALIVGLSLLANGAALVDPQVVVPGVGIPNVVEIGMTLGQVCSLNTNANVRAIESGPGKSELHVTLPHGLEFRTPDRTAPISLINIYVRGERADGFAGDVGGLHFRNPVRRGQITNQFGALRTFDLHTTGKLIQEELLASRSIATSTGDDSEMLYYPSKGIMFDVRNDIAVRIAITAAHTNRQVTPKNPSADSSNDRIDKIVQELRDCPRPLNIRADDDGGRARVLATLMAIADNDVDIIREAERRFYRVDSLEDQAKLYILQRCLFDVPVRAPTLKLDRAFAGWGGPFEAGGYNMLWPLERSANGALVLRPMWTGYLGLNYDVLGEFDFFRQTFPLRKTSTINLPRTAER